MAGPANALRQPSRAGVLTGDSFTGLFVTRDGQEYGDTASLATRDAGLIRIEQIHDGQDWVGGRIQLPDGEKRGPAITYNLQCGCYAGHKWCQNAYGSGMTLAHTLAEELQLQLVF